MLPSQRALFDIPRDVCYMNAAGWGPMPLATQEAGRAAMNRKGQPWKLAADLASTQNERARSAAAALIGAEPGDITLISSVGYGVASAAKIVDIPKGSRVIVLENDHTSPMLEWTVRAPAGGFSIDTVKQPADGDWTSAVLGAIERKGAAPLAMVSISSVHWSDGGALDLGRIAPAVKKAGGMLLVDALVRGGRLDIGCERRGSSIEIALHAEADRILLDKDVERILSEGAKDDDMTSRTAPAVLVQAVAAANKGRVMLARETPTTLLVGAVIGG